MKFIDKQKLAQYIDHTYLKENATSSDIEKLCEEALKYGFKGVCVRPHYLLLAAKLLKGSDILPITVIGFPSGIVSSEQKVLETEKALLDGAKEVDMVINIEALKEKDYEKALQDIKLVVKSARDMIVKVIIETAILSLEEKIAACVLAQTGGADFVKTSTGFSKGGATREDVTLIKKVIGKNIRIKASGGIKTLQDALKMIEAGADRIGTSASVKIMNM